LRPKRPVRAALAATIESLGNMLSRHRAVSRASLTALSFTFVIAFSQQAAPAIQAGPEAAPRGPETILPQTLGVALATDAAITISFDAPMDVASVEDAVQVLPAQAMAVDWNKDATELSLTPANRWRTDEKYLVTVGPDARAASGSELGVAQRYAFSTETATAVRDFQVRLVGADLAPAPDTAGDAVLFSRAAERSTPAASSAPTETASGVSATSSISVAFSAPMDEADTEEHFAITPEVEGSLAWDDGDLVFTPTGRLEPGARYTISVSGAHDADGNVIDGKSNFSFLVQDGAQITKTVPEHEAMNVDPDKVEIWFSQPMDTEATAAALTMTDTNTGQKFAGTVSWNEEGTQLVYAPDAAWIAGHTFGVTFADGAKDADGNAVDTDWYFTVTPPAAAPRAPVSSRGAPGGGGSAPAPAPVVPAAAPATTLGGYALNQVNAARAAYGFAPLVLDASISAVASSHANDQAVNGYFSHTGLNGSTRDSRLRAGGVSYSQSGENQCYYVGMSQQATLDWCHRQFMAEPYPGHWNHIANILDPSFTRMGVGIATVGGKTIITWNFTD
jgi:uncharacterized protein YkwD